MGACDLLIDPACYERGCACYSPQFGDEGGVEVVQRKEWIELTDQQVIDALKGIDFARLTGFNIAKIVSQKLKELNYD